MAAIWGALAVAAFPAISYTAASGTMTSSIKNGLFDMLKVNPLEARELIEKCNTTECIWPTAVAIFEGTSDILVKFFRPILDHSNPSLHLQGLRFLAILMSAWILMLIESYRRTPRKDPSKRLAAIFFLLGEFYGVGLVMPMWCLLNVLFSYTSTSNAKISSYVAISQRDIAVLPWALLIGGAVPTFLLQQAPKESQFWFFTQDFWILGRLYHSIFTIVAHRILKIFFTSSGAPAKAATPKEQYATSTRQLRRLYSIAFWLSTLVHWYTLGSIAAAHFYPEHFSAATVQALQPENIWPLNNPGDEWIGKRIASVPVGVGAFLLWDEIAYSAAVLLWGLTINQVGLGKGIGFGTIGTLITTSVLTVILGPASTAVLLVQGRDEK